MDRSLSELRDERDRVARETLALQSWRCARISVVWAVEAMLANSAQATTALGWLLRQIEALPGEEKEDAMTKVLDLSFAIAALARVEAKRNIIVPFPSAPRCASEKPEVNLLHDGAVIQIGSRAGDPSKAESES